MDARICELLAEAPVVTDGAWGTELQERGVEVGTCPDAWNLDGATGYPDRVEDLARAYVEAGSRIILTNTFGANRIALARRGLAERATEINEAGAAISLRASAGRAWVFGSIGPTGRILFTGELSEAEVRAAYAEQAHTLARSGVHGLVIETMVDLAEATIAVEAARATGLPIVACMAFGSAGADYRTIMGDTVEQAAQALAAAGADVIGANCGQDAAGFAGLCARLRAATPLPLWMKPNAGIPQLHGGRGVYLYQTSPGEFAAQVAALVKQGAQFAGGCCGAGPAFIRALARWLGRDPRCD
jgi:methionine synthase I (cobalamin-dependent)